MHGDDFTFMGREEELKTMRKLMEEWYDIKFRGMLGDDETDAKEIVILNRVLKWNGKHLIYKADDKHVVKLRKEFNMESELTRGSQTACDRKELEGDDEKLDEGKVSWFRGVAARANFLSLDRMDIQYAAKEICRNMAAPTNR